MEEEPLTILGISAEDWARTPQTVRFALRELYKIVQAQTGELNTLKLQLRDLQARLGQNSRNSSKPPSSDPPAAPPKPPKVARGRKAGGQVGHEGHSRPLLPPEQVDEPIELIPEQCPHCQTVFPPELPCLGPPQRTQVAELPVIRPHIIEYRQHTRCCPDCQRFVTADLPADAPPGAFGPRATALMAVLRGCYRFSLDDAAEFLSDVCQLPLSAASIVSSCERTSEALAPVDVTIQAVVQASEQVNVDETSWRLADGKGWLWVAVCSIATCFRIHTNRSKPALRHLLGECFRGIVGSDRFFAYNQLPDGQRQLCWAHLLRNLAGLADYYGDETRWPQRMREWGGELFVLWHLYKGGWIDQVGLQQHLIPIREAIRAELHAGSVSAQPKIVHFSKELLKHWDALWTFTRVEGVEPTNNAAERALRHGVLWRKSCFGSRSEAGARFVERMLSVQATCKQQQRSVFAFVTEAVEAAWAGRPAPVLVTHPAVG